jgi:hypothetical protein
LIGDINDSKKAPAEKVHVELLIRFEGSAIENRITTFEIPVLERIHGGDNGEDQLRFESKELLDGIIRAAKALK